MSALYKTTFCFSYCHDTIRTLLNQLFFFFFFYLLMYASSQLCAQELLTVPFDSWLFAFSSTTNQKNTPWISVCMLNLLKIYNWSQVRYLGATEVISYTWLSWQVFLGGTWSFIHLSDWEWMKLLDEWNCWMVQRYISISATYVYINWKICNYTGYNTHASHELANVQVRLLVKFRLGLLPKLLFYPTDISIQYHPTSIL